MPTHEKCQVQGSGYFWSVDWNDWQISCSVWGEAPSCINYSVFSLILLLQWLSGLTRTCLSMKPARGRHGFDSPMCRSNLSQAAIVSPVMQPCTCALAQDAEMGTAVRQLVTPERILSEYNINLIFFLVDYFLNSMSLCKKAL